MHSYHFPDGFAWGAATSAYQIEGAARDGGRKPSVWDTFAKSPGRVRTGETGDVACDHYHRFERDVELMASLGVKHYRFSIAWPRILPDGRGAVNEEGIDFYRRLVDTLLRHDITPHATLFHWDSPQALEDKYGSWRSREMAKDFAEYAGLVAARLGDVVANWMTMNEIVCFTHMGYGVGKPPQHAPGTVVGSMREVWQTSHHALLGHGLAVQAIRARSPRPCRISLVDNPSVPTPLTDSPADIAAAGAAFRDAWVNGGVLFPALTGTYSDACWQRLEAEGAAPVVRDGDLATIAQPLDGLGLNLYSGSYVRAADAKPGYEKLDLPRGYPRLDLDWLNLVPDCMYWAARHVADQCGFRGDLAITENGTACADEFTASGEILDLDRIHYLRSHLRQVHRAIAEGYPIKAYFVWSLMDNFEWSWGYAKRFGIIWTDYQTQRRILKASATWYAECIRQNRVV